MAGGDFDRDDHLDVALAHVFSDKLTIFLGNGDGTFHSAGDYATGNIPQSPISSNFNGDGNVDLAVSNTFGKSVGIYLGNGDGTFQGPLTIRTTNPIYSAAADLNRVGCCGAGATAPSVPALGFATGEQFVGESILTDLNGDGLPACC
jgi:hypothetical protein